MLTLGLTGCGEKDRILYKSVNLNKFVELADYKNIKVDTTSDECKKVYDSVVAADVEDLDLYVQKTEGKVAKGDTANIDYGGKKDGVAFEGGTAKGHDLEIGSNSFIDGFEEGLIGVEIGSTVDLNLTFPENYQSTDLAGKDVVFTVKVNYVKTKEAQKPEEYFGKMGFKTVEEYNKDVSRFLNVRRSEWQLCIRKQQRFSKHFVMKTDCKFWSFCEAERNAPACYWTICILHSPRFHTI